MTDVLLALRATLEQRKTADPDSSYVATLYERGLNKILEKVGEECTETLLAAKDYSAGTGTRDALIGEVTDLIFHTMVMLSHLELSHEEVLAMLESRFGLSGIAEKAARSRHNT